MCFFIQNEFFNMCEFPNVFLHMQRYFLSLLSLFRDFLLCCLSALQEIHFRCPLLPIQQTANDKFSVTYHQIRTLQTYICPKETAVRYITNFLS
jgi:hypothetical protein